MKKYHITITDNDTGMFIEDTDTDMIIGAIDLGTDAKALSLANNVNILKRLAITAAASLVIDDCTTDVPATLFDMAKLTLKKSAEATT